MSPLSTPRIHRHCSRCARDVPFESSGKFRVNAQKRRLDVWLVYRCERCELSFNLTILERASPEEIGAERLSAFHENDAHAAFTTAFDRALIARAGGRVELPESYRVERDGDPAATRVRLTILYDVGVRLDRLLAGELRVSRESLSARVAEGRLTILPQSVRALRRRALDGQILEFHERAKTSIP